MLTFDRDQQILVGPHGSLRVSNDDEITRKLAMLIEGECGSLGPRQAAETFGFSKPRYYQIRKVFHLHGAQALASQKRGPKRQYRRTQEVTRQVEGMLRLVAGDEAAGPIALLPPSERFHWLTAPRSAVLQTSSVRTARAKDLEEALEALFIEQCG